ncbi:hypothetical protein J2Y00_003599 [Deinococcus soli (ex Cha et al. 2016)]|uniref:Uncharacterized protein n=2 Tax=Deinococcus TaxID=1298 RepID=A0AAE3XHY0_9DEIO|nr:hypothetical protein [Deinococcus soli (ex Cha et al. 2016)]MDR6219988.1 hypothetical protein [Deinococcus soli (ex Cha et al. 2016)]
MDIAAGTLTLRPNSAAFSPKPGQQDLALLNQHLQERYALSTLHNGLLYRAVVGAAVADLMTRDSPTASPLAEQLLRQTIDAARLAWVVDRAGGRPQVRLSQPILTSQGVWYGPAEQVLNQHDLSAHCDTHSAAYMQAQYPLHVPQDGYWDGLEACLYAAPIPIMLPPHVRLLITDIRGRRQSAHTTPILWDAQVPAGHYNATIVHLSHPEAAIGEVVLVLDLPRPGIQQTMEERGALRSITYLTRTTSWQLGWQTTQRIQPDGRATDGSTVHYQAVSQGQWGAQEARHLALALAAVPRDLLPCTHRTSQNWPVAYYPLHPASASRPTASQHTTP